MTVTRYGNESQNKSLILRKTNQKISALGDNKKLGEALKCFRQLLDKRIHPNIITYTSLINAFVRSNEISKALSIFYAIINSKKNLQNKLPDWFYPRQKLRLNIITYTTIIKGLCNNFLVETTWNIVSPLLKNTISFKEPSNKRVKISDTNGKLPSDLFDQPSIITLNNRSINTILRGCVRCGDIVTTWVIYKFIEQNGDSLFDAQSILYITRMLCTAQRLDEARILLKKLKKYVLKENDVEKTSTTIPIDEYIIVDSCIELAISFALRSDFQNSKKYFKKALKNMKSNNVDDKNIKFLRHKNNERQLLIEQLSLFFENKKNIKEISMRTAFKRLTYIRPKESFVPLSELIKTLDSCGILYDNDLLLKELMIANNVFLNIFSKHAQSALTFGISQFIRISKSKKSPLKNIENFYKSIMNVELTNIQLDHVFENASFPLRLELCSGTGDWILAQALKHKNINWVSVEIRHDRVYQLFRLSVLKNVSNLYILGGNATDIVNNNLQNEKFEQIYINFPEPPAYFDHPNHLLCLKFFESLYTILQLNGEIIIVTDDVQYINSISNSMKSLSHLYKNNIIFDGLPSCYKDTSSYFDRLWINGLKTSRAHLRLRKI